MERLALGNRVREARMARGLTAEQLAGLCERPFGNDTFLFRQNK